MPVGALGPEAVPDSGHRNKASGITLWGLDGSRSGIHADQRSVFSAFCSLPPPPSLGLSLIITRTTTCTTPVRPWFRFAGSRYDPCIRYLTFTEQEGHFDTPYGLHVVVNLILWRGNTTSSSDGVKKYLHAYRQPYIL